MNNQLPTTLPLLNWPSNEKDLLEAEIIKLFKVILSSQRIETVRKIFNLAGNEYVEAFVANTLIIKKYSKREPEERILEKIDGKNIEVLTGEAHAFTKEKIYEYFDLSYIPFKVVFAMIFSLPLPFGKNRYEVERKRLLKIYGLDASNIEFKNINSIAFFDEKFEITKKYEKLQQNNPPREKSTSKYDSLIAEAKEKLQIKMTFDAISLSKIVRNFKKYFYENGSQ